MELKIHEFQISILRELLFKPGARFSELKKVEVTNDHFSFHVKHLVEQGLVEKRERKYFLTTAGKEFANRMDTEELKLERQAKLAIALHAVRVKKGKIEVLIHRRLKEPFYGWCGSNSGKIRWGETPLEGAKREFREETGLEGDFSLKGVVHYFHYQKDGQLLEDKYFWVYRIDNVRGKLKEKVPEGENVWMEKKEFKKLKEVFATWEEMMEVIESEELIYGERPRFVENY